MLDAATSCCGWTGTADKMKVILDLRALATALVAPCKIAIKQWVVRVRGRASPWLYSTPCAAVCRRRALSS